MANTGLGLMRTGSRFDKWLRAFGLAGCGFLGLYQWSKDSESSFWSGLVMPAANRFFADEEFTQLRAIAWLRRGRGPFDYSRPAAVLETELLGRRLAHPLMLGAGFDRNGECVYGCFGLGFSGVEVGTLTPQKQAGNGQPRIFRVRVDEAVISRAGAPNRGMAVAYHFLEKYLSWARMVGEPPGGLIGVNVGRCRGSPDLLDDAKIGVRVMSEVADYIAVVLPTPHLQGWNTIESKAWMRDLVDSCEEARAKLPADQRKPILYKVCLDMTEADKKIFTEVAMEKKIDGIIVGQGTLSRPGMFAFHFLSRQSGMAYGRPIKEMSTAMVAEMYRSTQGKIPIIGGGGISTGEDVLEKIEAGATAVQMHSALANHGPGIVPQVKRELARLMHSRGYSSINEAVGKAVAL